MALTNHSSATVTCWLKYFRQLIAECVDLSDQQIGGIGILVIQIDESKFAKRKYHKGRRKGHGSWVFGGIDSTGKYFTVVVWKRDKATLLPLIQKTYVTDHRVRRLEFL